MGEIRTRFQGVTNIVRFNWHYYIFSLLLLFFLVLLAKTIAISFQWDLYLICLLILVLNISSLSVSHYVYDRSGLYNFEWIDNQRPTLKIVNINAGFDETSELLQQRFKEAELVVFDFYDPLRHTEISIKRARKAYPAYPGTKLMETNRLNLENESVDKIFVVLSAHEIRNESERIIFFKELRRTVKPNGEIFVIEHLRDRANFLAYNLGFFHFHSKQTWIRTFQLAQLFIRKEIKLTPFISTFILTKDGNTL